MTAVSYTHLKVMAPEPAPFVEASCSVPPASVTPPVKVLSPDRITAVSYTHLDVYKRQALLIVALIAVPPANT